MSLVTRCNMPPGEPVTEPHLMRMDNQPITMYCVQRPRIVGESEPRTYWFSRLSKAEKRFHQWAAAVRAYGGRFEGQQVRLVKCELKLSGSLEEVMCQMSVQNELDSASIEILQTWKPSDMFAHM